MTGIDRGSPPVLEVAGGRLVADRVVFATNAWAAGLRELHTRLVAVTSDIVATEPIPDLLEQIGWTGGECITDSQLMVHYYRTTRDGRIAFGKGGWGIAFAGRIGEGFDRDARRAADVTENFHRIYPNLRDVAITHDWSGPIDRPADGLPLIGRLGGPRAPALRRRLERQRRRALTRRRAHPREPRARTPRRVEHEPARRPPRRPSAARARALRRRAHRALGGRAQGARRRGRAQAAADRRVSGRARARDVRGQQGVVTLPCQRHDAFGTGRDRHAGAHHVRSRNASSHGLCVRPFPTCACARARRACNLHAQPITCARWP